MQPANIINENIVGEFVQLLLHTFCWWTWARNRFSCGWWCKAIGTGTCRRRRPTCDCMWNVFIYTWENDVRISGGEFARFSEKFWHSVIGVKRIEGVKSMWAWAHRRTFGVVIHVSCWKRKHPNQERFSCNNTCRPHFIGSESIRYKVILSRFKYKRNTNDSSFMLFVRSFVHNFHHQ